MELTDLEIKHPIRYLSLDKQVENNVLGNVMFLLQKKIVLLYGYYTNSKLFRSLLF